jgi:MFS transporter, OCT family, solute carrier family 22 (organic cation transporter), member 4/5
MISRIFTLCVPFVGSLAVYWKPLPLVVLGIPTVLAGILALVLPETLGKVLPQTIQEANLVSSFLIQFLAISVIQF